MIEARFAVQQGSFTLDVDLQLPASGVTVLFGPSGCGKTTLLRCLAGLQRAPQGRLLVAGQVWQDHGVFVPTHQRGVGLVFQEASLFPHLTVQGNLDYGLRRTPAANCRMALTEVIALLDIGALLQRRPDSLSGGERQRVAIARALAGSPQLLLMDEPLAALDARRKAEILPVLERLAGALSIPIVYVTHAVAEAARLADHLVLLDAGRVQAQGPLQAVSAQLDGVLAHDDDAGVVLACTVTQRDAAWQLARLDFAGGALWARDAGHALGQRVRVRVAARDVSLALAELPGTSISNQLPGVLVRIAPDVQPSQALALVRVGPSHGGANSDGDGDGDRDGDGEAEAEGENTTLLMARLTRRSADRLQLRPGLPVWVQVKSVALLG